MPGAVKKYIKFHSHSIMPPACFIFMSISDYISFFFVVKLLCLYFVKLIYLNYYWANHDCCLNILLSAMLCIELIYIVFFMHISFLAIDKLDICLIIYQDSFISCCHYNQVSK